MINLSDIAAFHRGIGGRSGVRNGILAGANAQKRLHRSVAMADAAGTMILREW